MKFCYSYFVVFMLAVVAVFFCADTKAQRLSLWYGIDTYHVDRAMDDADNEQNKINAIFYDRWLFSTFINSYSKRSELIGYNVFYEFNQQPNYYYHYGLTIAAATGYGRNLWSNIDGVITIGVSPFLGGQVKLSKQWWAGLDMLYLPTDNGGVLVSGLNITFQYD